MIVCSNCDLQQLDGTMFCDECGASLLRPSRPHPCPSYHACQQRRSASLPPPCASGTVQRTADRLCLMVSPLAQAQCDYRLVLGRYDRRHGSPDIDLEGYGGSKAGISRQHASLAYRHGCVLIEDLASTNGTFINQQRVPPHRPAPVQCGDILALGELLLQVA